MALPQGRRARPLFVGVVHLLPLPGAPQPSPGLAAVLARALADARALAEGGADALIVENLGDAPFHAEQVDRYTVAAMTRACDAIRSATPDLLLGVNVLRNDALAAVAIAAATGADFVRINVHTGVMVSDQGVLTGRARETLLERTRLGADVGLAADVLVKHASPLGDVPIAQAARDLAERGLADAVIVTGSGTGQPIDRERLDRVRAALPRHAVWGGSGLDPSTLALYGDHLDGAIVGTWLHAQGDLARPVDPVRVRQVRAAIDALR